MILAALAAEGETIIEACVISTEAMRMSRKNSEPWARISTVSPASSKREQESLGAVPRLILWKNTKEKR